MRILIVGAGVAGLTLAGLLRRQGERPTVIDWRPQGAELGYVLGLWPHGTRVLHALGIYDAFQAESEPMLRYALGDSGGRLVGSFDLNSLVQRFGQIGAISRPGFIRILERALDGIEIRRGVSVEKLSHFGTQIDVRLTDGSEATFDLVVGADGIHSHVRELVWGDVPERDTGWGCLAWWADKVLAADAETREHWGVGNFLGVYPCRDRLGIVAGAPVEVLQVHNPNGRADRLKALFATPGAPIDDLWAEFPSDGEPVFLWRMSDVRAPSWVQGRVVLVGDAAAAFLPTAGIGASMALESAAVLADELSRTDAAHLPNALDLYVKRRRRRVEVAQSQSRRLARLVFTRSQSFAFARDRLLRFMNMERMVRPLIKQLTEPI